MTSLGDKAEASDTAEIRLARDSRGEYTMLDDELVPADELGTDDFPQYGDFLPVDVIGGGPESELVDDAYIEVPGRLAKVLVSMEIGVGDSFEIQNVRKNAAGEWEYSVREVQDSG